MVRAPVKLIGQFNDMTVICEVFCMSVDTIVRIEMVRRGYLRSQ